MVPQRDPINGRFLKGNKVCTRQKRDPDQPIELHPTNPARDKNGMLLPGFTGNPLGPTPFKPIKTGEVIPGGLVSATNNSIIALKAALLNAISPEELQQAARAILGIVLDDQAAHGNRIQAFELLCDRFFGKPSASVNVTQAKTETKLSYDLTKVLQHLSEDELQNALAVQTKLQQLEAKPSSEIVIPGDDAQP